jgi:Uncharacterised protein family (UPF0236)
MEIIVTELVEKIKVEHSFLGRERAIMIFLAQLITTIVQSAFQEIDEEESNKLKEQGYVVDRKSIRTVGFLFGSVHYSRRRMKSNEGDIRYPLDEFLGIRAKARYSSLVMRNVSELGSMMVYRHVAQAINLLTNWSMSHQNVQQLVIKTGEMIEKRSTQESRYDGIQEKRKVKFLYIEGDGVTIRGQKKKKLEIHRFQVHEGSKKQGNRTELINCHSVGSMNRKKAVKETLLYIESTYDLSQTIVITNSDGGSGYEKEVFDEFAIGSLRHEHFRDIFHVHRKIKERLSFAKKLQSVLIEAIAAYNWDRVLVCMDTAESLVEGPNADQQYEQIRLLKNYLERNWAYLKSKEQRGIVAETFSVGTMEASHRKYTYRTKRQGRIWSIKGSEAIVRVINSIRNDEIDRWLNQYNEETVDENELQQKCQKMKRWAMKKDSFISHCGAFRGSIKNEGPISSALGKLSKALNGLNIPNFL